MSAQAYENIWVESGFLPKPKGEGFLASLPVLEKKTGPYMVIPQQEYKSLLEWIAAEMVKYNEAYYKSKKWDRDDYSGGYADGLEAVKERLTSLNK